MNLLEKVTRHDEPTGRIAALKAELAELQLEYQQLSEDIAFQLNLKPVQTPGQKLPKKAVKRRAVGRTNGIGKRILAVLDGKKPLKRREIVAALGDIPDYNVGVALNYLRHCGKAKRAHPTKNIGWLLA